MFLERPLLGFAQNGVEVYHFEEWVLIEHVGEGFYMGSTNDNKHVVEEGVEVLEDILHDAGIAIVFFSNAAFFGLIYPESRPR